MLIEQGRKFVRFTEQNDHEGESWSFYLPYETEADINAVLSVKFIVERLTEDDDDSSYYLALDNIIFEHEVDALVRLGGYGYMDYHNKIDSPFNEFKCINVSEMEIFALGEFLYKGGIKLLYGE